MISRQSHAFSCNSGIIAFANRPNCTPDIIPLGEMSQVLVVTHASLPAGGGGGGGGLSFMLKHVCPSKA